MNGASRLPRISLRLWFSITIVNTVPDQPGAAPRDVAGSAWHAASVLPDVFGLQLATTSGASHAIRSDDDFIFGPPENVGLDHVPRKGQCTAARRTANPSELFTTTIETAMSEGAVAPCRRPVASPGRRLRILHA